MNRKYPKNSVLCLASIIFIISQAAYASEFDDIKTMIKAGQLEPAAQKLAQYVRSSKDKSETPEVLLILGKLMDKLTDKFSGRAEKVCYWNKGGSRTPDCMDKEAAKLNKIYGENSFKFISDIAYMPYSGVHYRELIKRFPKSPQVPEAEFLLLLKDLVGLPDTVLPKIKAYLDKYKSGESHSRGLLLWARVNKDIWYIHKEWSWVIYNDVISSEELTLKAEPYRQEALKTYKEIIQKYGGTFEADAAKHELALLKANKYDNETYSILADSVGGQPSKWSNDIIK